MVIRAGMGRALLAKLVLPGGFSLASVALIGIFESACSTTRASALPVSSPESERTVADLRAKNAGYVRRIEELENRVFILEDQLDSRKLAAEQKAAVAIPTRRLGKGVDADDRAVVARSAEDARSQDLPAPSGGATPTSLLDEQPVEYSGDARPASAGGASDRPRLQLTGKSSSAGSGSSSGARASDFGATDIAQDTQESLEPLRVYRASFDALRARHHEQAELGFHRFLQLYPQHDYADNAQYWLGECSYDRKDYVAAERAFRRVIERYPRGNKVPDAMLKLGFSLSFLGDRAGAKVVLESLTRAFPKHEAARLASAELANPSQAAAGVAADDVATHGVGSVQSPPLKPAKTFTPASLNRK